MEWFRHDLSAQQDIKIRKLIRRYGYEGYGLYWHVVEMLFSNNGALSEADVRDELEAVDNPEFLDDLIKIGLVQCTSDKMIVCERIRKEIEKEDELKQARHDHFSSLGKASGESRRNKNKNTERTFNARSTHDELQIERDTYRHTDKEINNSLHIHSENYTRTPENEPLFESQEDREEHVVEGEESEKVERVKDNIPYKEIVEAWNSEISSLPKCTRISDKRRKAIAACYKEYGDEVYNAIKAVQKSNFLSGRDGKWNGCSFDWVFITGNMLKILEGNYSNSSVNGKGFTPTDLNGQYDDEEVTEVTEL